MNTAFSPNSAAINQPKDQQKVRRSPEMFTWQRRRLFSINRQRRKSLVIKVWEGDSHTYNSMVGVDRGAMVTFVRLKAFYRTFRDFYFL